MIGSGGISSVPGSAQGDYPQYNGIYYGVVSNNTDPNKQNRCLLRVPMLLGSAVTTWAVSLTPQQTKPAVGALVACLFLGGDLDYPAYYVVNPQLPVESSAANIKPVGVTTSAGTSTKYAAADHVHGSINTTAATVSSVTSGASASAGTSPQLAAADHVHAVGNLLAGGSGGELQLSSSLVTGGDTPATIELYSSDLAGQTTVEVDAAAVTVSGTVTMAGIVITTAPTNPAGGNTSYSIAGTNSMHVARWVVLPDVVPGSADHGGQCLPGVRGAPVQLRYPVRCCGCYVQQPLLVMKR